MQICLFAESINLQIDPSMRHNHRGIQRGHQSWYGIAPSYWI